MPTFITLKREWRFFDHSGGGNKATFVLPGEYEVEKEGGRLVLKGTNIGIDEKYLTYWRNPDCGEWQVIIREEAPKEVAPEPQKEVLEETQKASPEEPEKISPEEILKEIKKKQDAERAKEKTGGEEGGQK